MEEDGQYKRLCALHASSVSSVFSISTVNMVNIVRIEDFLYSYT
jgi:hypothetical protein